MIPRIALLCLILLAQSAGAKIVPFYIGTFTDNTASQGIYRATLDTDTGKLGPVRLAVAAKNPNFLAYSPKRRVFFAALDQTVVSYRLRPNGTLDLVNNQPSGGVASCFVSLDPTESRLFVANYVSGNVAAFPIYPSERIGEQTALIAFTGSGPNLQRQAKSYAHSIYVDPEGRTAYACDLGSDHVWILRPRAGTPSLVLADPPSVRVPPGSGPRHLAFRPNGRYVYVVNEMGLSVTTFARDPATGQLTSLGTVSNLPAGTPSAGSTAAEIVCSPSGKWLYVSNRGVDTLSVFALGTDGLPNLIQYLPAKVKFPRSFALDPTGSWLIAAGEKDNRLAVFRIDRATGRLSPTDSSLEVPSPVCVLFLRR